MRSTLKRVSSKVESVGGRQTNFNLLWPKTGLATVLAVILVNCFFCVQLLKASPNFYDIVQVRLNCDFRY